MPENVTLQIVLAIAGCTALLIGLSIDWLCFLYERITKMSAHVSFCHQETSLVSRFPSQWRFRSGLFLVFIGLVLAIFLASCASTNPSSIVQKAYDRLNNGDVDGFMELVSDDAVFIDIDGGRHVGSQANRQIIDEMVTSHFRVELSKVSAEGNVVTSTATVYEDNQLVGIYDNNVDVIKNGQIIFDGLKTDLEQDCQRDPDQAFCPGQ